MERRDKPKIRFVVVLLICAAVCIPRFRNLSRNTHKLEFYESEIARLKQENEVLKNRIDSVNNDPFWVEKIARENFGLMKPGEYEFKLKPENSAKRSAE